MILIDLMLVSSSPHRVNYHQLRLTREGVLLSGPDMFTGHTSGIKDVAFFRGDTCLVSCADDRTLRVWDRNSGQEVHKIDFSSMPTSLEVSKDGSTLTVSHGYTVSFWDSNRYAPSGVAYSNMLD